MLGQMQDQGMRGSLYSRDELLEKYGMPEGHADDEGGDDEVDEDAAADVAAPAAGRGGPTAAAGGGAGAVAAAGRGWVAAARGLWARLVGHSSRPAGGASQEL